MNRKRSAMGQYIRTPIDMETRMETLRLARALAVPIETAMCLLFRFMVWADQNCDGQRRVDGVDAAQVDAVVRHPGFAAAAEAGGILFMSGTEYRPEVTATTDLVHPETRLVRMKKLEQEAQRVAEHRSRTANVRRTT